MTIKNYKDLDVWKKGMEIVKLVYQITKRFPKEERYALTSQMQRAAVSIPSNIAEGHSRHYTKEYIQFCYVSLGSCAELETLSLVACDQAYINSSENIHLNELLDHEGKMLTRLITTLKNS